MALNKEEVKKIIPEILDIVGEKEEMLTGPESQEELQEKINQFFDKIGEIMAEVWIGKKDFYLYKLDFEKEVDLSKFEKTTEGTIAIKFVTEFDKFNQPIEIAAPEEFKTIKEILTPREGLFGPLEEARTKARDARRQSDIRQILLAMEMYYDEGMAYLQTENMTAVISSGIGNYLPVVPQDPQAPTRNYTWINNTGSGNDQRYCIYAHLESGKYLAASNKGTYELLLPPKTLEDCEKEVSSSILKFPFGIEKFMASIEEALSGILNK